MAKNLLNERFPANTFIYVGRRTFRHDSEPDVNQDERIEKYPEQYPHTFVDVSGSKVIDVAVHASGKQGVVVDVQKVIRPEKKTTIGQANAWRRAFVDNEELRKTVVMNCQNISDAEKQAIITDWEPYVVIDFKTAGTSLDIPLQPSDKLTAIKEQAPEVYEAMLANLDEEAQLEQATKLYDQLMAMSK